MPSPKRPPKGRPTLEDLEYRKARVLQTAEKLFMTRGYAGTSVSEISKRSQVWPRLITAHFGDKSDIFSAVITKRNLRALSVATGAIAADTLEDVLFGAAKFAWTVAYAPNAIEFLRLMVGEGSRFTTQTSKIALNSSNRFFREVEAIFQQLVDAGSIPPGNVERMAKYFVDLTVGFSLIQAGMGYWGRVPDDDELRDKVRFFCGAISHFADPPPAAPKPGS